MVVEAAACRAGRADKGIPWPAAVHYSRVGDCPRAVELTGMAAKHCWVIYDHQVYIICLFFSFHFKKAWVDLLSYTYSTCVHKLFRKPSLAAVQMQSNSVGTTEFTMHFLLLNISVNLSI